MAATEIHHRWSLWDDDWAGPCCRWCVLPTFLGSEGENLPRCIIRHADGSAKQRHFFRLCQVKSKTMRREEISSNASPETTCNDSRWSMASFRYLGHTNYLVKRVNERLVFFNLDREFWIKSICCVFLLWFRSANKQKKKLKEREMYVVLCG